MASRISLKPLMLTCLLNQRHPFCFVCFDFGFLCRSLFIWRSVRSYEIVGDSETIHRSFFIDVTAIGSDKLYDGEWAG
jgi:hypothetical protein